MGLAVEDAGAILTIDLRARYLRIGNGSSTEFPFDTDARHWFVAAMIPRREPSGSERMVR
jgi:hypothetical protein